MLGHLSDHGAGSVHPAAGNDDIELQHLQLVLDVLIPDLDRFVRAMEVELGEADDGCGHRGAVPLDQLPIEVVSFDRGRRSAQRAQEVVVVDPLHGGPRGRPIGVAVPARID